MKMLSILACPICHNELRENNNMLFCVKCNTYFTKLGNVFSFICRNMYKDEADYSEAQKILDFWGNGWIKRLSEPDHKFIFDLDKTDLSNYASEQVKIHKNMPAIIGNELGEGTITDKVALNIGCGAGGESLMLAYLGAKCIGMDITNPAAAAADTLIKKLKGDDAGFGVQADSRFLPIKSDSVDVVYSSGVLHHSPDIKKSISEIYRVLKPGAKAFVMLYSRNSLLFITYRLKGLLSFKFNSKKYQKFLSDNSECAWLTSGQKNPYTETFTKGMSKNLFVNFRTVSIRKGSFNLTHFFLIHKYVSTKLLSNISNRYFRFLEPYLGACLYITVEK